MYQQTAAVDVAQKIVAETGALGSALDYAGDIGHYKRASLIDVHNAEVREQCCKVVVCDLRVRLADDREQGGFADVREADETHIGKKLKLKRYIVRLAGETRLCKTGDLPCRSGKMLVAPAALAAASRNKVLAVRHVVHYAAGLGIAHEGAARNADIQTVAVLTRAALALTVRAVSGNVLALVSEVHQRGHVIVNDENDIAAAAAVAAVGTAGRNILFAMERDRAVAAVAGLYRYSCFINKRGSHISPRKIQK